MFPRSVLRPDSWASDGQDDVTNTSALLLGFPRAVGYTGLPNTATVAFLLGVSGRIGATSSWCALGNGNNYFIE